MYNTRIGTESNQRKAFSHKKSFPVRNNFSSLLMNRSNFTNENSLSKVNNIYSMASKPKSTSKEVKAFNCTPTAEEIIGGLEVIFNEFYNNEIFGDILVATEEEFEKRLDEKVMAILGEVGEYNFSENDLNRIKRMVNIYRNRVRKEYQREYELLLNQYNNYKKNSNKFSFLKHFRKHCTNTEEISLHLCKENDKSCGKFIEIYSKDFEFRPYLYKSLKKDYENAMENKGKKDKNSTDSNQVDKSFFNKKSIFISISNKLSNKKTMISTAEKILFEYMEQELSKYIQYRNHKGLKNDDDILCAYVICEKCKKCYRSNYIEMYCSGCRATYLSNILYPSQDLNILPATWQNYHCSRIINEIMKCIKCKEILFIDLLNYKLKCLNDKCNFITDPKDILWVCTNCASNFRSDATVYNPLEFQYLKNTIKNTLLNKVKAYPFNLPCCKVESIKNLTFRHKKECIGILYKGKFKDKTVIICDKCKSLNFYDCFLWTCPLCQKNFREFKFGNKNSMHKINNVKSKSKYKPNNLALENKDKSNNLQREFSGVLTDRNSKGSKENSRKNIKKCKRNHDTLYEFLEKKKRNLMKNEGKSTIEINEDSGRNDGLNDGNDDNEKKWSNNEMDNSIEDKEDNVNTSRIVFNNYSSNLTSTYKNNKKDNKDNSSTGEMSISTLSLGKVKLNVKKQNNTLNKKKHSHTYSSSNEDEFLGGKKNNKSEININTNKLSSANDETNDFNFMNDTDYKIGFTHKSGYNSSNNNNTFKGNKSLQHKTSLQEKIEEYESKMGINNEGNVHNNDKNNNTNDDIKDIDNDENMDVIIDDNEIVDGDYELFRKESVINPSKVMKKDSAKNIFLLKYNYSEEATKNEEHKEFFEIEKSAKVPKFNDVDFTYLKAIGEGSYGVIYLVEDKKTKKEYALKKIILDDIREIRALTKKYDLIYGLDNENILKIFKIQYKILDETTYCIYTLMERAECDWSTEIKRRNLAKKFYTEKEILDIMNQLVNALCFLQTKKITHRDIKPENILIFPNNVFKIADLGEAKQVNNLSRMSTLKGSQLFMSPILYKSLGLNKFNTKHNPYKSDVFSLGYCFLNALCLNVNVLDEIREVQSRPMIERTVNKYLCKRYSKELINIILKMIEVNESNRFDFIQLMDHLENMENMQ